jgi:hypothetical protein
MADPSGEYANVRGSRPTTELTQLSIEVPTAGEAKGLYRTLPVTGNTTYG